MIFTRANYTGPCPAEKMAWVFYCCTHRRKSALLRLFKWGLKPLAGLVSSQGVSPCKLYITISGVFLTHFWVIFISFGCHSISIKHLPFSQTSSQTTLAQVLWTHQNGLVFKFLIALLQQKWTLVSAYKRWRSYSETPCSSVWGKHLNVSFHTYQFHPVQVDAKFIETRGFVSSLCLSITLMCSTDWCG